MLANTQTMHPAELPVLKGSNMTISDFTEKITPLKLISPTSPLEKKLLQTPEFAEGLNWGKPRFGHPEGKVGLHIREVLQNIDRYQLDDNAKAQLRLLAIVHDTFKYQEEKTKSNGKRVHHARIARKFMEQYTDDQSLLNMIELHDEAFYAWRQIELNNDLEGGQRRLERLLERIGENLGIYFLFFKADTETGDKVIAPLHWFESVIADRADEATKAQIAQCINQ